MTAVCDNDGDDDDDMGHVITMLKLFVDYEIIVKLGCSLSYDMKERAFKVLILMPNSRDGRCIQNEMEK